MPSSGARSGTRPSRNDRGAGDGRSSQVALKCGHGTYMEPVWVSPDGTKTYRCPDGCGLVKGKR